MVEVRFHLTVAIMYKIVRRWAFYFSLALQCFTWLVPLTYGHFILRVLEIGTINLKQVFSFMEQFILMLDTCIHVHMYNVYRAGFDP